MQAASKRRRVSGGSEEDMADNESVAQTNAEGQVMAHEVRLWLPFLASGSLSDISSGVTLKDLTDSGGLRVEQDAHPTQHEGSTFSFFWPLESSIRCCIGMSPHEVSLVPDI